MEPGTGNASRNPVEVKELQVGQFPTIEFLSSKGVSPEYYFSVQSVR
jgi:hypothetical protein